MREILIKVVFTTDCEFDQFVSLMDTTSNAIDFPHYKEKILRNKLIYLVYTTKNEIYYMTSSHEFDASCYPKFIVDVSQFSQVLALKTLDVDFVTAFGLVLDTQASACEPSDFLFHPPD